MEPGARKMNGGTMGRASQNNHSAQLCKGLPSRESFLSAWIARAAACRTYRLELPSPSRHANRSNGSRQNISTQRST